MSLLKERIEYKPFTYPWAYHAYKVQNQTHWLPEEVSLADDVRDWKHKLTEAEKHLLTNIFRFFTQADIDVQGAYLDNHLSAFKPTEIRMMLSAFANMENIHIDSYSYLIETLGMPDKIYKEFLDIKEMRDKHEFIKEFNVDNKHNTALTLAVFGGFIEGVQLFATFAILLNFQRFNKMKGMGQIMSFITKDECYSSDTRILTTTGWKLFADLNDNDKVAQYDKDTKAITFVKPKKIVSYGENDTKRKMLQYPKTNTPINFLITPNHRKLVYKNGLPIVIEAQDLKPRYEFTLPTGGYLECENANEFTDWDRLRIVIQADAHIPTAPNRTGLKCGYKRVKIQLKKERKIARLREILNNIKIDYVEKTYENKKDFITFYISMPLEQMPTKYFKDWVLNGKLENINSQYAKLFMEEIIHWDGSVKSDTCLYYSSTVKENVEIVQIMASLCGKTTNYYYQDDNRKSTYKRVHRLSIYDKQELHLNNKHQLQEVDYTGKVWCVEVDTGFLVVERNGRVCVSGNTLHSNSLTKLFREFINENPEIWTSQLREEIYLACNKIVYFEDKFIDLCFNNNEIEGLESELVKQYIRFIADIRLKELGLAPHFHIQKNPLPWLDNILNGVEHVNFFENRATEYSKSATKGEWDDDVFN